MYLANSRVRTVVLLGAGATRGAYRGIGKSRIRPPLNSDFFSVAERFVSGKEGATYRAAFKRVQDFLNKEVRLRQEEVTMEGVFNILFMSKDLPSIFRRGGPFRKAGFRREITDFFGLLVGLLRYVQENPRHPNGIDHHLALARALTDDDSIISLNYDTLIDNALLATGWNPAQGYGFPAGSKLQFRNAARAPRFQRKVLLLKPHGSLNWFAKGTLQSYESVLTKRAPSTVVMSSTPPAYRPSEDTVRFFVPPLYSKFFTNRFWSAQWEQAYKELTQSEALVVIGCSLIETDFHLRSIVARALMKRRKKFRRIILVEPHQRTRRRLKQLLRARSATGFELHSTFTDFVNHRL